MPVEFRPFERVAVIAHPQLKEAGREAQQVSAYLASRGILSMQGYWHDEALCARIMEREFDLIIALGSIPPGGDPRPADTGWFASVDQLSGRPGETVPYAADAFRFWGSTFDPSGLYRFNAAMDMLAGLGVTVADIHAHATRLQSRFLSGLERLALPRLPVAGRVPPAGAPRGNFLAFDVEDAEQTHQRLLAGGIYVDRRDRRLRFGFGVYHDEASVDALLPAAAKALR